VARLQGGPHAYGPAAYAPRPCRWSGRRRVGGWAGRDLSWLPVREGGTFRVRACPIAGIRARAGCREAPTWAGRAHRCACRSLPGSGSRCFGLRFAPALAQLGPFGPVALGPCASLTHPLPTVAPSTGCPASACHPPSGPQQQRAGGSREQAAGGPLVPSYLLSYPAHALVRRMRRALSGRLSSCGRPTGPVPGCNAPRHLPPARSQLPPEALPCPLPGAGRPLRGVRQAAGPWPAAGRSPARGRFRLERITKAVERFLACGDYRRGMARIKCTNPDCGLEYFRPLGDSRS
jgi:hypothetical protein